MKLAFTMKLYPGAEAEYQRRHNEIWPELVNLLKQTGISNYAIFLNRETDTLFGIYDVADQAALENLPLQPVMQKWWAYMSDIMDTNPDQSPVNTPLKEVFYLP